jgi:hypothetical protein
LPNWVVFFASRVETATSSEDRATGSGFRKMVLMRVKIVVLAPIPRASDSTAAAVKPGFLTSMRAA